jgi:hypothetical protein
MSPTYPTVNVHEDFLAEIAQRHAELLAAAQEHRARRALARHWWSRRQPATRGDIALTEPPTPRQATPQPADS